MSDKNLPYHQLPLYIRAKIQNYAAHPSIEALDDIIDSLPDTEPNMLRALIITVDAYARLDVLTQQDHLDNVRDMNDAG